MDYNIIKNIVGCDLVRYAGVTASGSMIDVVAVYFDEYGEDNRIELLSINKDEYDGLI